VSFELFFFLGFGAIMSLELGSRSLSLCLRFSLEIGFCLGCFNPS
jgi:hypothetical protein